MKSKKIVFVSGANRGIGFEFARQIHERGDIVIAGYRDRNRSQKLLELDGRTDRLHVVPVDVTRTDALDRLYNFIGENFGRLDWLINNAGIQLDYDTPLDQVEPENIMENFRVNVVGPFMASKFLRPLLALSKKPRLINITSVMGSIALSSGNATPYRISKAAVNMLTKNQALAYNGDGIITIAMHPGWVRTDMGGPEAHLSPTESVTGMLAVIDKLKRKDNGSFLAYDGKAQPY